MNYQGDCTWIWGFSGSDDPLSYHSAEKPRGFSHGAMLRFGSSQRNTMVGTFYRILPKITGLGGIEGRIARALGDALG